MFLFMYSHFHRNSLSHVCKILVIVSGKIKINYKKIVPSKAVVGVDRPMKAPSMHIQKPNKGKLSKFSRLSFGQKLFFLNKTPSCICSMCLNCIGKVSNCSIISCGRS